MRVLERQWLRYVLPIAGVFLAIFLVLAWREWTQAAIVSVNFERSSDPSGVNVSSVYSLSPTSQPYKDLGLYIRNAYPAYSTDRYPEITDRVIAACGANGATEGPLASSGTQVLSPVPMRDLPANLDLSFSSSTTSVERVVDYIEFDIIGLGSDGVRIEFLDHNADSFTNVVLKNPFGGTRPHASCTSGDWSIKAHVKIDVAQRLYTTTWRYNDPFDNPDRGIQDHGVQLSLPATIDNIATLKFVALPGPNESVAEGRRDGFYVIDTLQFSTPVPPVQPTPSPMNFSLTATSQCDPDLNVPENSLTWTRLSSALFYGVFRDGAAIEGTYLGQSAQTYIDNDVVPGQSYTYFIRGYDAVGGYIDTSSQSVSTLLTCPGGPTPTPTSPTPTSPTPTSPTPTSPTPTASTLSLTLVAQPPGPLNEGNTTELVWTVAAAQTCTALSEPASSDWSGSKIASDGEHRQAVQPLATTVYRLSCQNPAAQPTEVAQSVRVQVRTRPRVSGDVISGGNVSSVVVTDRSIVAANNRINVGGSDYHFLERYPENRDWQGISQGILDEAMRLVRERRRNYVLPEQLSGTFNLNPPPSISLNPLFGLVNDFLNPEGSVWVREGDLQLGGATGMTLYNRGTIIVVGGDVEVSGNLFYGTDKSSFGLIVLAKDGRGGNLTFRPGAQEIVGSYFATGTISIEGD